MLNQNQSVINNHDMYHVMSCHDTCHEVINNSSNHDMSSADNFQKDVNNSMLSKDEWHYLTKTLDGWRVYNPRAVVKKNPLLAWRIMNLCKDPQIRVKGAYFTVCFRKELEKIELQRQVAARTAEQQREFEEKKAKIRALFAQGRQKLGIT